MRVDVCVKCHVLCVRDRLCQVSRVMCRGCSHITQGSLPITQASRLHRRRGQSILEYVVLIAAVATGVSLAANLAYKAFAENAQDVQSKQLLF